MFKNCLASLGLIFLLLLGVGGIYLFYEWTAEPGGITISDVQGVGASFSSPVDGYLDIPLNGDAIIDKFNPLGDAPTQPPPPPPTMAPAPTPVPDPKAYEIEVMLRTKTFADALNSVYDMNARLEGDAALISNGSWHNELRTTLDSFSAAAWDLSNVGPVPQEFQAIDGWLKRVGPEAQSMRDNYLQGVANQDQQYFQLAGENMKRVVEYMTQAVNEMLAVGWGLE